MLHDLLSALESGASLRISGDSSRIATAVNQTCCILCVCVVVLYLKATGKRRCGFVMF